MAWLLLGLVVGLGCSCQAGDECAEPVDEIEVGWEADFALPAAGSYAWVQGTRERLVVDIGGEVRVVGESAGAPGRLTEVNQTLLEDAGFVQLAVANVDEDVDDELVIVSFGTQDQPGRTRIWVSDGEDLAPRLTFDVINERNSEGLPPVFPRVAVLDGPSQQTVVVALEEHPWDPSLTAREVVFVLAPTEALAEPCSSEECVSWFGYRCEEPSCVDGLAIDTVGGAVQAGRETVLGVVQRNLRVHDLSDGELSLLRCVENTCARFAASPASIDPSVFAGAAFAASGDEQQLSLLSGGVLHILTGASEQTWAVPVEPASLLSADNTGTQSRFLLYTPGRVEGECRTDAALLELRGDIAGEPVAEERSASAMRLVRVTTKPGAGVLMCATPSSGNLHCYRL